MEEKFRHNRTVEQNFFIVRPDTTEHMTNVRLCLAEQSSYVRPRPTEQCSTAQLKMVEQWNSFYVGPKAFHSSFDDD